MFVFDSTVCQSEMRCIAICQLALLKNLEILGDHYSLEAFSTLSPAVVGSS